MQNDQTEQGIIPDEVNEIFDLASLEDELYSAMWVPGGIQLVHTKDKAKVVKEHYWPEADKLQKRLLQAITNQN